MVEFLELGLCEVGKGTDLLIVVLLQLLVVEDYALLREVEHEPVVPLLLFPVTLTVLPQVPVVSLPLPAPPPHRRHHDQQQADPHQRRHRALEHSLLPLPREGVEELPYLHGHHLSNNYFNIIREWTG